MTSSAETHSSPIRLLFVSSSDELPERVAATLEEPKVVTRTVDCLDAAVNVVEDERVDCVVTTNSLPNHDAVALVEALRTDTDTLPIVLLATDGSERLAMRATRAGVTEYIPTGTNRSDESRLADRIQALTEQERERRAAERERVRLERTSQHLESLLESAPLAIVELDADAKVRRWNQGAEETFGWTNEEVMGEVNPVIPEKYWGGFEDRMERFLDGEEIRGVEITGQTKAGDEVQLLLSAAPIPTDDGQPQRVTAVLNDITEQKRIEWRLRELQRTAQELSVSPSVETIGKIATDAAANVLGLELTGFWRYDDVEEALIPVSVTSSGEEIVSEIPRFASGNSLAWEVFQSGTVRAYDDLEEVDARYNPESTIRSEILVPLGEYGVLLTGSPSPKQFSETDIDLFRILGATVEAALVRAHREEELRLQNERLDEFADVVAHDLRNPLTVAKGFLKLAEAEGEPEQFRKVESALDRIGQLIDDLLTLAQGEATVENPEPIDVGDAAERAWELVDTAEASMVVRDSITVTGDSGRLRQLFENLFRNSVEHGSDTCSVTVTVGALPAAEGFYVEDDGTGILPERRKLVVDHGVTFSEDGTGFGLSIVADIVRAHGWSMDVTESESGGARFEFRLAA